MLENLGAVAASVAVLLPVFAVLVRLLYVLPALQHPSNPSKKAPLEGHVMILLGSGGHTGEMLRLLQPLRLEKVKKTWLVSSGDSTSLEKARKLETSVNSQSSYITLKRARTVGQLWLLSVVTTLFSIASTFGALLRHESYPDVLLINGPGTCVPVAYVLFLLKFLGLCRTRIVYVESLARVSGLSLSGRLVLPVSDRFLVQWESLARQYKRAEFHGILV